MDIYDVREDLVETHGVMAHVRGIRIAQVWTRGFSISFRVRVRVGFILKNLAPPGSPLYVPTAGSWLRQTQNDK